MSLLLALLQDEAPRAGSMLTPHNVIRALMLLFPLIAIVITFVGWSQLKAFLDSHSKINTRRDLGELQMIARKHVGLARVIRPLLLAGTPLFLLLLFTNGFEGVDLAFAIGPSILCMIIGFAMRPTQRAVEAIPANDESRRLRDQIVEAWHGGGSFPAI